MTVRFLATLLRQAAGSTTIRSAALRLAAIAVAALLAPPADLAAQARLGDLDFPTSVDGDARSDFLLGLGYLHSFEYVDAAEAFRSAQQRAPDFALAYWGEALTYDHPLWGEEDLEAARAALERLAPTTEARLDAAASDRERAYLAAVETLFGDGTKAERDAAYERAMARLAEDYPDDEDAAALHALAILGTSEGRDHETYMRAAAVAEQVIERHPRHPGAVHYLIHAYDDPIHAGLGLSAARVYAEIAPDASHALHMPSHVFFALGMWDELIAANERAWQVSVERMERLELPAATRNFHALFWMHYGYLQAGRRDDAARALAIAEASARDGEHRWTAAQMRAHHLADLAADGGSTLATGDAGPDPAVLADRLLDTDAAVVGDRALAAGLLAVATYALTLDDPALLARAAGRLPELADAEGETLSARLAIEALAVSDARPDSAVTLLEAANNVYFAEPYVFGPPTGVVRPPAELLGQALTELGRYREARRAYDLALSRAPGRRASVAGVDRLDAQATDGVPLRDARLTDVRRRVIERIEAGEIPSMAVVVLERGRVLWSEGLGLADREAGRPATPQTVYRVGSMSKSIMATGALTLVERGLLELDDPVASPLAKLGLEIVEYEPGDELRFWHLLNMRAGIPHGWMSLPADEGVPEREARDRYLGLAAHSVFPPGEVYHYSNFSTSLPSAVVEGVTGQPFPAYMRQHLFAPLGMSGAGVGAFDADPAALATPRCRSATRWRPAAPDSWPVPTTCSSTPCSTSANWPWQAPTC